MRATDWTLLVGCIVLLVAGPAMAVQELAKAEEEQARAEITGGEALPLDPAFRGWWRGVLLATLVVVGVASFAVSWRIAKQPKVRAVSGRLLALLLVGVSILDLAFFLDGRLYLDAPYQERALTIVWLYPLAAILMGGATLRLVEVERVFTGARPTR